MFEKFKKNLEKFRELSSEGSQDDEGNVMVEKINPVESTANIEQIKIPERVEQVSMSQSSDRSEERRVGKECRL